MNMILKKLFFAVLLTPVLDGFKQLLSSHDTVLAVIKSGRHQLNPTRNWGNWERRESNPGQLGPEASVLTVVLCRPPIKKPLLFWLFSIRALYVGTFFAAPSGRFVEKRVIDAAAIFIISVRVKKEKKEAFELLYHKRKKDDYLFFFCIEVAATKVRQTARTLKSDH